MRSAIDEAGRRRFLMTAGVGLATTVGLAVPAEAADPTPNENANMKLVTEFCQAFASHDVTKIMSFMAAMR